MARRLREPEPEMSLSKRFCSTRDKLNVRSEESEKLFVESCKMSLGRVKSLRNCVAAVVWRKSQSRLARG